MEMKGEKIIFAPKQVVWDALNDPDKLVQAIPGAQNVEKSDDENLTANVRIKIGPISAKFSGKIKLSDINPPNSYTLTGEGSGGAAGFAKGVAKVALDDHNDGTVLKYSVEANVGGKLAQIGQRLIDTAANKLADEFFGKFRTDSDEAKDISWEVGKFSNSIGPYDWENQVKIIYENWDEKVEVTELWTELDKSESEIRDSMFSEMEMFISYGEEAEKLKSDVPIFKDDSDSSLNYESSGVYVNEHWEIDGLHITQYGKVWHLSLRFSDEDF